MHPFPYQQLKDLFNEYENVEDIVWCQEEPLNAGSWTFVQPRLDRTIEETSHKGKSIKYAGRNPSASVATGMKKMHVKEEEDLLDRALGVKELV